MMPPADRIHKDPSQRPRKHPSNVADHDFQAVGPALRILHLNVEGLSPAKCSIIQSLAEKHYVDVICLEETHVKAAHSPPLSQSWTTSHIVNTVLQLSTSASSYLSSEELNVKGGISGRPTGLLSLLLLNVPFR